eukprot:g4771.t1
MRGHDFDLPSHSEDEEEEEEEDDNQDDPVSERSDDLHQSHDDNDDDDGNTTGGLSADFSGDSNAAIAVHRHSIMPPRDDPPHQNSTVDNEDHGSDTDEIDEIPELELVDDNDAPIIENDDDSPEENQGENDETPEHEDHLDDTGNADAAAASAVPPHALMMGSLTNPTLFNAFLASITHHEDAATFDSPEDNKVNRTSYQEPHNRPTKAEHPNRLRLPRFLNREPGPLSYPCNTSRAAASNSRPLPPRREVGSPSRPLSNSRPLLLRREVGNPCREAPSSSPLLPLRREVDSLSKPSSSSRPPCPRREVGSPSRPLSNSRPLLRREVGSPYREAPSSSPLLLLRGRWSAPAGRRPAAAPSSPSA